MRHLMKRARRLRRRDPKVAPTTTGSWGPRLRRRGGACLVRSCDKERAARASLGLGTGRRNSVGCPRGRRGPSTNSGLRESMRIQAGERPRGG